MKLWEGQGKWRVKEVFIPAFESVIFIIEDF